MNYIPGFSNYLETTVPEYGPAPIMDAEPVVPQRAAVMPMTQEAVAAGPEMDAVAAAQAAYAASQARSDASANFMTKQLAAAKANPNSIYELANPDEYYNAYGTVPISFTGNSGYMDKGVKGPSIDYLTPEAGATYSLYSPKTGQLISSGSGAEGLMALAKQANALNESQGRSADFQLVKQSAGSSSPEIIGSNLYNSDRTKLGKVAGVVGQALPLAALAIPGLNVLGGIAVGAGLGGAGAAMQGKNVLSGAAMGGLSAAGGGVLGKALQAGGQFGTALAPRLATAIGTGVGSTAGGLVTGQSLKNALIGGIASGGLSYLSPDIQEGLGIGKGTNVNTSGKGGGGDINADLIPNALEGLNFGSLNSVSIPAGVGGDLNVIGRGLTPSFSPTNVNLGALKTPAPAELSNDIVVRARQIADIDATPVSAPVTTTTTTAPAELSNDIVVRARQIADTDATPVSVPVTGVGGADMARQIANSEPETEQAKKEKLGLEEYLRLAGLAAGLVGGGAAGGGSGQSGTYGGVGSGRLNPIFSAKLPAAGGLGNVGLNRTQRPMGDVDWLTYGTRPELNFYDYAAQNNPAPANPAPITTPVPGNPAGPAMYAPDVDNMRFAEGGAMPAKRGGRSQRTEFAVNGPGTGRSDDIPAVLSDGEYVIDAETVALLGDGSSKAGAKKLDDLRVKVRKHKGQKLAKGRFSANAKKPEAYLSGGRI